MGHHVGSKSSIVPLIDRLNKYPVGLPDSEKLREILSLLFAENEAFIASRFPLEEATLEELTKATDISGVELRPQLEQMCEKGLVMDL
ncbi:MAG: 4Fe-4S ferredoxin, partial [Thermodesulfobacteriota bacterium]|nr:4Fe-4S ferredoxin [Thermodesulfobacteriota bacterium]